MNWREDPGPSTPPATPEALRRHHPRRESLLPPRALPSFFGAGTLITGAGAAAFEIHDPTQRALVMALCGFLAWLMGYVTPPPRRSFRREDDR